MKHALRTIVASLMLVSFAAAQDAAKATPPGAPAAAEALAKSSRHGEWVDIAIPGSDVKLKTWIVFPERTDNAPVVLVIHEIFGLTDWVRGVADQLAAEGFIAVAPDFLSGKGPNGGATDSFEEGKAREAIRTLSADDVVARLDAAREYAIKLPAAKDKVATIGFCWGGTQSFIYATRQPQLNAAVVYYGSGPKDAGDYAKISAPVLGLYGSDDQRVNSTIQASEDAMKAASKTFTKQIYEGAGHGFLRQQDGRDGANLKASKSAWNETVAFLKKQLG